MRTPIRAASRRALIATLMLGTLAAGGTALAQSGEPIKVGALLSLTGGGSVSGTSAIVGLQMRVKEINDAGGLLGRRIDVIQADDRSDPTAAVGEALRLVRQEKITFMIGPQASQHAIAITPALNESGIAWVTTVGASQMSPEFAPRHFSNLFNTEAQAISMVNYVANVMKAKSVGILTDNTANSKDMIEYMKRELGKTKVTLMGTQEFDLQATDMTPNLLALRRGNPEALLFSAITAPAAGNTMRGMKEIGWDVRTVGSSVFGVLAPAIIRIAGQDALKTALGLESKAYTYCPGDPVGTSAFSKFLGQLKAFSPSNFDKLNYANVIFMYDGMQVLRTAAEATKSLDGATVAAWIEQNVSKVPVVNGPLTASKTNHFMMGADILVPVMDLGQKREDGLLRRATCG
jgi:ABC-type branched-subunit amino acid transport system substrate-binding protein